MIRLIIFVFVSFIITVNFANGQNNSIVNVTGKVLRAKDSIALAASILYEKLPYYDDMGIAKANGADDFSFWLVKGLTYNISIKRPNFKALTDVTHLKIRG